MRKPTWLVLLPQPTPPPCNRSPRRAVYPLQISLASFPYGGTGAAPFSYSANITTGNFARKAGIDAVWAPLLAFAPPSLLIKAIADMGTATAADTARGIRFADAYGYCTLAGGCDPDFSVGKCWGW